MPAPNPKYTVDGNEVVIGDVRLTREDIIDMLRSTEKRPPGRFQVSVTGDGPRQVAWLFSNNMTCLWVPNRAPGGGWNPLTEVSCQDVDRLFRGEVIDISYGRKCEMHSRHITK